MFGMFVLVESIGYEYQCHDLAGVFPAEFISDSDSGDVDGFLGAPKSSARPVLCCTCFLNVFCIMCFGASTHPSIPMK